VGREIMAEIKKLSDRVQYLEDQLVKQRRENANLLEELETSRTSGVSSSLVGQVDKKFSEIMQTEEKIQMTVADVSNEARKQYSKYEQTAQKIETEVADLSNEVDGAVSNISKIEQTASSISSTVTKIYGATEAVTSEAGMTDKTVMYHYNDAYYYFNDVTKKWEKVNGKSVVSQLIQTEDGFVLDGNVKISGEQIVDGVATLRDNVNVGDANTMNESRSITFNSVAKISTIKGADLYPNEYAGLSISAPLLKLGSRVDFSDATVTGLYAVFE
jgi:UTP:GlnB (protein PII) uridylyltransferase